MINRSNAFKCEIVCLFSSLLIARWLFWSPNCIHVYTKSLLRDVFSTILMLNIVPDKGYIVMNKIPYDVIQKGKKKPKKLHKIFQLWNKL